MRKVSFEDIGAVTATFLAEEGVVPGQVVKISKNDTVAPCADGDPFCGVALSNEGGCAAVQLRGFLTVPASGLTPGRATLAANASGGVKVGAEGGVDALVVSMDGDTAVICL